MMLARCPKCNKEVKVDTSAVLTSIPARYNLDCPNCGRQYVPCKDCYEMSTDNTTIRQDILKKIEELERHQKEHAKVLDDIEDRLSNLEHK